MDTKISEDIESEIVLVDDKNVLDLDKLIAKIFSYDKGESTILHTIFKIDEETLTYFYSKYRKHAVQSKCSFLMINSKNGDIMGGIWASTLKG